MPALLLSSLTQRGVSIFTSFVYLQSKI